MKKGGGKKKRFDKKNAVRFSVVPRDMDDPLVHDPKSSNFVLKPVGSKASAETQAKILQKLPQDALEAVDTEPEETFRYLPNLARKGPNYMKSSRSKGLSEVPHDYDYSQHMREMGGGTFVPADGYSTELDPRMREAKPVAEADAESSSSTSFKLPVGPEIINDKKMRAAVVQSQAAEATHDFFDALEGDEAEGEYEELLDDFIQVAMGDQVPEHYEDKNDAETSQRGDEKAQDHKKEDYDGMDDIDAKIMAMMAAGELGQFQDEDEDDDEAERQRRRRLDEHFATLYAEFEDDNLGELEEEELEGGVEFEDYEGVLDEQLSNQAEARKMVKATGEDDRKVLKKKIQETVVRLQAEEAKDIKTIEREINAMYKKKPKEKWDCESILSTYSSASNHPSLIVEPRRGKKQIKLTRNGLALEGLPERPRKHALDSEIEEEQYDTLDQANLGERRPKKETKEERKARKAAAKARKREARSRKKGTRTLFKAEKNVMDRNTVSNAIANPAGIKL